MNALARNVLKRCRGVDEVLLTLPITPTTLLLVLGRHFSTASFVTGLLRMFYRSNRWKNLLFQCGYLRGC
jgi:hypothetical protein